MKEEYNIIRGLSLLGIIVFVTVVLYGISPVFYEANDLVWRGYVILVFGMMFVLGIINSFHKVRKDENMCR